MRTRLIIAAVLVTTATLGCSRSPTAPAASTRRPSFDGGVTFGSGNRDGGVTVGSGNSVPVPSGDNTAVASTETTATGVTFGSGN